ncbi:glycerol kinase GlpK [Pelomonas sp. KK5]|uniref:glycerol kinase GlpK n=1 Tax=Pelomonas sp. KK5 TaxID=1855730 RepID=UPI00097C1BAE|nr:glycerol kinase GlpK [Pelomonas sp. KK5]
MSQGGRFLLALDQGTSSSRSIVFDREARIVAMAQRELPQHFPQAGWVEHDPRRIWQDQLATAQEALAKAGATAADIAAIGITNQRETTLLWDRRTGEPLHRAIVWQDRRAEPICAALRERGLEAKFRQRTGLRIDAYFSGPKLRWLLDQVPGAQARAERGELAFGTVDSWLLWQLTEGRVHATDVSNASRTMLFDIARQQWDAELLDLLNIPASLLPAVHPSSYAYGETTLFGAPVLIGGIAGDQQSALFGQACFGPGLAKNTYGTGCFLLMHGGGEMRLSQHGLVTSNAAQASAAPQFALEGSVFVGGAVVQWLRDGLGVIKSSTEVQALAASVPDAGGVMMVPAFTGLGAPYWDAEARGSIVGLTRGSTAAHIARAAVESIAYQSAALIEAMARDAQPLTELRVDGGAAVNDLLMQFQADLLGIPVIRPENTETTALGAAFLAGLAAGTFSGLDELTSLWRPGRRFEPGLDTAARGERMARWAHAVRQTVAP